MLSRSLFAHNPQCVHIICNVTQNRYGSQVENITNNARNRGLLNTDLQIEQRWWIDRWMAGCGEQLQPFTLIRRRQQTRNHHHERRSAFHPSQFVISNQDSSAFTHKTRRRLIFDWPVTRQIAELLADDDDATQDNIIDHFACASALRQSITCWLYCCAIR